MYFYCNIINYKATGSGHIAVKFTIMTLLEEVGSKYQCRHLLVSAFLPPLWGLTEHWDWLWLTIKNIQFLCSPYYLSHRSLLPHLASHWHGMSVYNKQLGSPHFHRLQTGAQQTAEELHSLYQYLPTIRSISPYKTVLIFRSAAATLNISIIMISWTEGE